MISAPTNKKGTPAPRIAEKNNAAEVTLATWVMSVQIKLSVETLTRSLPEVSDAKAIVPKVLNAYWTTPNTQRGNNRMSSTSPRSPADTAPPAIVTSTPL